jgi:hypothetical protein
MRAKRAARYTRRSGLNGEALNKRSWEILQDLYGLNSLSQPQEYIDRTESRIRHLNWAATNIGQ